MAIAKSSSRDIVAIGVVLIALLTTIAFISARVAFNRTPELGAASVFVGLAMISGLALIVLARRISTASSQPNMRIVLGWIIVIGIALRLIQFFSVPIYEDDWHRYLWEGALISDGISPYTTSPSDGFDKTVLGGERAPSMRADINQARILSQENDQFAYKVAYPYLSTIYPLGAQTAFLVASKIEAFDLRAWRGVLLIVDSVSLGLLLWLLTCLNRSLLWIGVYWWNPLVILTGFNGAHMDILLGAPLLGLALASHFRRPVLAGVLLGLCVSIKLWPALLAPIIVAALIRGKLSLPHMRAHFSTMIRFAVPFAVVSMVALWPLLTAALEAQSGLSAYAQSWQKNTLIFGVMNSSLAYVTASSEFASRILVAALIGVATLFLSWQIARRDEPRTPDMINAIIVITAMLVLMAPAGYPWYAIWFAVLLPIVPTLGLFVLCTTFFLYYLRFAFEQLGYMSIFDSVIVPIEFGLPLIIILASTIRQRWTKFS